MKTKDELDKIINDATTLYAKETSLSLLDNGSKEIVKQDFANGVVSDAAKVFWTTQLCEMFAHYHDIHYTVKWTLANLNEYIANKE